MKRHINKSLSRISGALALACFALFSPGCGASITIQSVKDPTFSNPIHKMFIILNHGQVDKIDSSYTPYLVAALKDEFSLTRVEIQLRVVNPLTLNENVYQAEIASYNPDGVLTIVANGGVAGGGGLMKIFYDISLFDLANKRRIWRAQVEVFGQGSVREQKMKAMAKDLVQRLSEDKMISPEPRHAGEKI